MDPMKILAIAVAISLALHFSTCILLLLVMRRHNRLCENVDDIVSAKSAMWTVLNRTSGDSIEAKGIAKSAHEQSWATYRELRDIYESGIVIEVHKQRMH